MALQASSPWATQDLCLWGVRLPPISPQSRDAASRNGLITGFMGPLLLILALTAGGLGASAVGYLVDSPPCDSKGTTWRSSLWVLEKSSESSSSMWMRLVGPEAFPHPSPLQFRLSLHRCFNHCFCDLAAGELLSWSSPAFGSGR